MFMIPVAILIAMLGGAGNQSHLQPSPVYRDVCVKHVHHAPPQSVSITCHRVYLKYAY